jgi:hypothetical protein
LQQLNLATLKMIFAFPRYDSIRLVTTLLHSNPVLYPT